MPRSTTRPKIVRNESLSKPYSQKMTNKTTDRDMTSKHHYIKSQYKPIIKSTHILRYPHKGDIFSSPIKSSKLKGKSKKKKVSFDYKF